MPLAPLASRRPLAARLAFVLPLFLLVVLLGLALPFAARASGAAEGAAEGTVEVAGGLPYAVFEAAVEHADLAGCPAGFDTEKVFCRLTIANDAAHVFVFSWEGEQQLQAVRTYALGDGFLPF